MELSVINYAIDEQVIILGELQKSPWINAIILNTKTTIFDVKINLSSPNIETIKKNVILLFNYERFKYRVRGREENFEKRWGLYIDYFEDLETNT